MSLYETDFYAWTQQQAALVRDGRWEEVDRSRSRSWLRSLQGCQIRLKFHYQELLQETDPIVRGKYCAGTGRSGDSRSGRLRQRFG